ncbi:MAG: hypothetical protein Q7R97_02970 [Candidatus Daviesbacteria bacterium]|nr:hypothetical protein [Candidatus Daviesbacteria bacterium]
MLDPKNSTQISNKGETNTRPTPIGGPFGFFEEKEPELGSIVKNCLSAIGKIEFHLDSKLPTQVTSTLFEAGKWTTIAVGEGIKEVGGSLKSLAKEVFVSEKPKTQPKPEEKKKMEDGLALRQALEVIENARISSAQQEMHKSDSEAERLLGRRISVEEANQKLKRNTSFTGGSRYKLSLHELVEIRATETDETKIAKKTESPIQVGKTKTGFSMGKDEMLKGGENFGHFSKATG